MNEKLCCWFLLFVEGFRCGVGVRYSTPKSHRKTARQTVVLRHLSALQDVATEHL